MLCWCLCFLFFKQKTAYEMRISDWSSDVCSSDLACQNRSFIDRSYNNSRDALAKIRMRHADHCGFDYPSKKINLAFDLFWVNIVAARYHRSEERRVGQECDRPCSSRWSRYH